MRIAVYLRVSTDKQTVDNQRPDIEAYLKTLPSSEVTYFEEHESAWVSGHQAELARLKEEIRSGKRKYDLFIVWAFDRLTRGGSSALIREYEFFISHGVKVISLKESWSDVPVEFAPVMLALFGYLAQMESKRRSERTLAGLARVRKYGSKSGVGIGQRGKDKPTTRRKRSGYRARWVNK
jgi:DNA invertase Pin-like site-specific DNA recombinase